MDYRFHVGNRRRLYESLPPGSLVVVYSGKAPRKTGDEYYPFFANRNFVYLTGVEQQESILCCYVGEGEWQETLYLLPPDAHAERWTGRRLTPQAAAALSGVEEIAALPAFPAAFDKLAGSGKVERLWLDFDKLTADEPDSQAYRCAAYCRERYPFLRLENLLPRLRRQRTLKQACEIDAMRQAEKITAAGIVAMMQASRPGMYEYQYKAEFDYALAQHGVLAPGFPSIISAGENNFCIHYYDYRGQAQDGDMVLNDVGACWDNEINDVSRGWPCNGRFSERQRLLYECAYATSEHMFGLLQPGMPMADVDRLIREYNFERLQEIGLCKSYDEIGKYMWHGGAHHVGYDVHDIVDMTMPLTPGMVFCIDIGIYCEEWGIGFRLEDNCLITESGCENLSAVTPRSIEQIEAVMGR